MKDRLHLSYLFIAILKSFEKIDSGNTWMKFLDLNLFLTFILFDHVNVSFVHFANLGVWKMISTGAIQGIASIAVFPSGIYCRN